MPGDLIQRLDVEQGTLQLEFDRSNEINCTQCMLIDGVGITFGEHPIGLKGTKIFLDVDSKQNGVLAVLEGPIEIWKTSNPDNKILVNNRQQINADTGQPLGEPIEASSEFLSSITSIDKIPKTIEEPQGDGGGCLIATAAYGTELAPQIQFLREIRDNTVMSTASGVSFMTGFNQLYYSFSPTIADLERENPMFQEVVRAFITPMISTLSIMTLAEDGSEVEVLGLGISVIALNLAIYIAAPALIGFRIHKHFKNS